MAEVEKPFLLPLLFLCSLPLCLVSRATNITTDKYALLALKAHITKDPNGTLAKNWSVDSPVCDWIGVTCGSRHLRVTILDISNMNLTGTLPPQLGNLSFLLYLDMSGNKFHGDLPNEFARCRRLQVLNLAVNNLHGRLPHWLGSLHKLTYLNLGNNSFSGLIPPSISNLSNLATLLLPYNSLGGNIPAEIFNISTMKVMDLGGHNKLSGWLPDVICQHLPRLNQLFLDGNQLCGQIPSNLGRCEQLQVLSLHLNQFTGLIPEEIGNLKILEGLYLGGNRFEGEIPKTISNLTMLTVLDITANNLTGEIPKDFGNLTMLEILSLPVNHITGVIPQEVGNFKQLIKFDLSFNNLTGLVPTKLSNISTLQVLLLETNQLFGYLSSVIGYGLPNLEVLGLAHNYFCGLIPESISNFSRLNFLELSKNNLTGPIPNSIGNLRLLKVLNLGTNDLTTESSSFKLNIITSLKNCEYLEALWLNNNPLHGILPDSLGNLSTLNALSLSSCGITGPIPSEIGNLSNLVRLDLRFNQLSGSLPNRVKDLQNLQGILLAGNQISSGLHLFCFCQNLGFIDLADNYLRENFPKCIDNITASLRYIYLGSNRLKSNLPTTIWNLKDLLELDLSSNFLSGPLSPEIKNFEVATWIDLSMNQFSGGIPNSIGEILNLNNLFLDHNRFWGSIPESFGKLLSLQKLDLSCNTLTGTIPMSLESLKYLEVFNVSFNNLRGKIPSGGPFVNFTGDFFTSNEALCGDERFQVPPCQSLRTHKWNTKKVHKILLLLAVIAVAGVIVLGLVYQMYRRQRKSSHAEGDLSLVTHERISYYKLQQATDAYSQSNLLGVGSFGSVYKGTLDDGRVVAVKVFNLQPERSFNSFDVEVEVLRNLRHRNLTKVISSCSNPDFKALIFQYMPNGSLDRWLYSQDYSLDIMQRLNIMIDVACALQYLHCENLTPVVHCDLKPSNVLLDEAMVAHITDFGLAKLLFNEENVRYTETLATLCYIAPEYGMDGLVSTKCDVYSFGIMMMEVFTGISPSSELFGENLNLISLVESSMPNGLAHVIDTNLLRRIEEDFPEISGYISSILEVALTCTRNSPRNRTNIQDVAVALNKIKLELLQFQRGIRGSGETIE